MSDETRPHIGGQAVIEGVMIRNRDIYSIAVRKPNGDIEVVRRDVNSPASKHKFLRTPFLRGVIALFENLVLGIKSLLYSAEVAIPEDEKTNNRKNKSKGQKEKNPGNTNHADTKSSSNIFIVFGMIPALALGVGLFLVLPNVSTHFLGLVEKDTPFLFNIVAGLIRLAVFLLYIVVISFMKDIKRTFQYHGAEHKSIFCYEDNKPLIIDEVRKYKTMHPRCGTSFLFFVFFITIIVFPLITVAVEFLYKDFINLHIIYRKLIMIFLHIVVALPIIASLSYELLKLSDKMQNSLLMKVLIAPGLLLQRITTKEPDDKQLEVAITAVKTVL
ncbi:MAG: DUF1385 domain-containing protein [Spirochaetota bacterium]|nr:MAG: DUF1385 domain-containing protein [Spirochaetota bacterium]